MKKKAVALLLCVSMMMTLNACGKTNNDTADNTEIGLEADTESYGSSADIEYNASDYVTLGDYKNMEVTLDYDYAVTDESVEDYINSNVIAKYPYYVETDKTVVEDGDVANIDYEGLLDGVAFEGGTAQGVDLKIGSGSFISGFEDGLIGAEIGKEVELNLTFPENYDNTNLAGQDVVFKVTVNVIKQQQDIDYDTLTDDYVKYLSDKVGAAYETVDDLTTDIRTYLEEQAASSKDAAVRSAVIDKLNEICTVNELPAGLLETRVQEYIDIFTDNYCADTTLEDYLANSNTTVEDFTAQISADMETELNLQLILEAVAEAENIELDEDGFAQYVSARVSSYGYESEDDLYKNYAPTPEAGKAYLQKIYVCTKALDMIIENGNVSYSTVEETVDTESTDEALEELSTEEATEQ